MNIYILPRNLFQMQLISLRPPYGSCGKAPLYLYEPGLNYTYSRCTEQCAAEYALQRCGCVDAYMPGMYYCHCWSIPKCHHILASLTFSLMFLVVRKTYVSQLYIVLKSAELLVMGILSQWETIRFWLYDLVGRLSWASCLIRKTAGCACAKECREHFPVTAG